jgi:hypothetical protein
MRPGQSFIIERSRRTTIYKLAKRAGIKVTIRLIIKGRAKGKVRVWRVG